VADPGGGVRDRYCGGVDGRGSEQLTAEPATEDPAAVRSGRAGVPVGDLHVPAWRGFPGGLAPAAVFLLGQALALLALAGVARASSWPLSSLLQQWDGQLYLAVARSGYSVAGPAGQDLRAFFPGYPGAVRGLARLTGLGLGASAGVVSGAAGTALAYGVDRLSSALGVASSRGRLTAVFLVGALPLSVLFLMPYAEALFCALAVWALVCLARRRWMAAGLCTCAAGLVRPTGVAVVLAVVVASAVAWRRGAPDRRRALAACAVAPLGTLAYLVWAAISTGRPDAWSRSESRWGTRLDGGAYTWSWIRAILGAGPSTIDVFVLGAAACCVAAVTVLLLRRPPGALGTARPADLRACLAAYVVGVLGLALGTSGVWNSKYRLQLPALVVACVVAAPALARLPGPLRAVVLAVVAALGCWFSVFAVVRYPYAL
jgi:hypothetical protein